MRAPFHGSVQHYGSPWLRNFIFHSICHIFLQCPYTEDVTSKFSLAPTLVLLHPLPGGGQCPPWGLLFTLGVAPDYLHLSTLTRGLF